MWIQQLGVCKMNETIEYYNQNADSFISGTINSDMSECRDSFLKYVKPGGLILDAGCGSGRDSLVFLEKGFSFRLISRLI